jgi:hypothetical protein
MAALLSRFVLVALAASASLPCVLAQSGASSTDLKYQLPPAAMVKMVDAPPTPVISLSPPRGTAPRMILIEQGSSLPTIADLAEPELRLAGLRFNPKVGAPSRVRYAISLKLQTLPAAGATAAPRELDISGLPAKVHVLFAEWSPDGEHIALVNVDIRSAGSGNPGFSLWVVDVAKAHAERVNGLRLNAVLAEPIAWLDRSTLAVPARIRLARRRACHGLLDSGGRWRGSQTRGHGPRPRLHHRCTFYRGAEVRRRFALNPLRG